MAITTKYYSYSVNCSALRFKQHNVHLDCRTNLCGTVSRNISSMQLHVSLHVFTLNLVPLDITRFSRQFVPDLASCSLSAHPTTSHSSWTTYTVVSKKLNWKQNLKLQPNN